MAKQKKLQKDSEFNDLDLDNDGVVSDNELAAQQDHALSINNLALKYEFGEGLLIISSKDSQSLNVT